MKKTILILVVLAMLLPSAAMAAAEFSLGGFIKLDMFWDSTQQGKNMNTAIARNNDQNFQHGRFNATAQGSRFNLTIKGPKLWGATTTAFIEMDFDTNEFAPITNTGGNINDASHNYTPRLRHAMFRLNWPETELMFGQYWCFTNEFYAESAQDGSFQAHGQMVHRLAQIRLTQKFLGAWTVAGMIGVPTNVSTVDANLNAATGSSGQSSETPQLQVKASYEADLWGKAPFYGRPRAFTAQLSAAWQRLRYQSGTFTAKTFGNDNFSANFNAAQRDQQYLDPWIVQLNLFLPVLPTYSNNLAGSASISTQWYVGQGLAAFGGARDNDNSWFSFQGPKNVGGAQFLGFDRRLTQAFGGYVQAQYWFTNQWYLNTVWGMQRSYGINRSTYAIANFNDQTKLWWEYDVTLYYRPIESVKFGLQYSYGRTDWQQKLGSVQVNTPAANVVNPGANPKDYGEAHRIEFVAFLYF